LIFFKKQELISQFSRKRIKDVARALGNGAASKYSSGSDSTKKLHNTGINYDKIDFNEQRFSGKKIRALTSQLF
jgi:hypothetical protein